MRRMSGALPPHACALCLRSADTLGSRGLPEQHSLDGFSDTGRILGSSLVFTPPPLAPLYGSYTLDALVLRRIVPISAVGSRARPGCSTPLPQLPLEDRRREATLWHEDGAIIHRGKSCHQRSTAASGGKTENMRQPAASRRKRIRAAATVTTLSCQQR